MKINTLSLVITLSGIIFVSISLLIIILGKKVGEKGEQKIKIGKYVEVNTNSVIFLILVMACLSLVPLTLLYWKPDLSKCIDKDELDLAKKQISILEKNCRAHPIKIKVMDSDKDYNVYNPYTAALGGSNTQEILGILALKKNIEFTSELVNPAWRDYDKIIRENPDVLIIHNSSFKIRYREVVNGERRGEIENDYENIFTIFLKRISKNTNIHFLIYSRKIEFKNPKQIIYKYVNNVPYLKDRITIQYVPEDLTFLAPEVANEMNDHINDIINKIKED